jgi:ABC-type bacteriocin/lantibiotic exporter with double-glycine peptidase domain
MQILEFPDLRQASNYDCGAVAVQSVLAYYGIDFREDKIIKMAHTSETKGTSIAGVKKVLKHFRLRFYEKELTIDLIKKYIRRHVPVILLVQAWAKKNTDWDSDWKDNHFVVAIGYSQKKIYFEDPSTYNKTYLYYHELEERWHNVDLDGKRYIKYGIAVYSKKTKYSTDQFTHMD